MATINKSISAYSDSSYEAFREYERYAFLIEHLKPALGNASSLLDIGCAKGELLYLLKDECPHVELWGLEKSAELLELARNEPSLKGVTFVEGDASGFQLDRRFDVAIMSGVLSIFDEIEPPLEAMLDCLSPGGRGFVFGGFSGDDIDVKVSFRNNKIGNDYWEGGWNMFSIQTVERALGDRVTDFVDVPFHLRRELPRDPSNPVRSYTVPLADGSSMLMTGGNVVRDFHLLSFVKKPTTPPAGK